jgi:Arc/MetJ family transcription regulator
MNEVIHRPFSKLTVGACMVVGMSRENLTGRPEDLSVPESAPPPKTVTDVDDALLAEAQLLLGLVAENDTVNLALAGLITEQRRLDAVESELRRYRNGQFTSLHQLGSLGALGSRP